jgi:alkylation response protein AidB-like acyl-CoA dehydrogenase
MSEMRELHDELRAVARELLDKAGDEVEWRQFADAGWLGLEVPESLGGAGASFVETAIVLEELGRSAARSRYLAQRFLRCAAGTHRRWGNRRVRVGLQTFRWRRLGPS